MTNSKTITICASVSFYPQVIKISGLLQEMGYKVLIPQTALQMKQDPNFSADDYKKAYLKDKDYKEKQRLIDDHIKLIEQADAVLVVNDEKNGFQGYIGGNVLMEMTVAYFLKKPIFILNPINENLPIADEIFGINPRFLNGDIKKMNL